MKIYIRLCIVSFLLIICTTFDGCQKASVKTGNDASASENENTTGSPSDPDFLDDYEPLKKYYVNFAGGDDSQSGTSPDSAWKHAPGDPDAIGNAQITLQPGDMVLLKGGVLYKGTITINADGTSTDPIVYKGDGWGTEKAVIDGSEPLNNWVPCSSASDCGGNNNWANIYHITAPIETTALTSNLYQDDEMLFVSQHPNPPDPFFMDDINYYQLVSNLTRTTATDAWLADIGGEELIGSYAFVFRSTSEVDFKKITAYNASANKITFLELRSDPFSAADKRRLAIANNLNDLILDKEGEYYFDESAQKIYLWPLGGKNPNTTIITISVRSVSLNIGDHSHIAIDGFKIQKGIGTALKASGGSDITLKNNEVSKWRKEKFGDLISILNVNSALIKDNYLTLNARLRGFQVSGDNIIVKNNRLIKLGRTPIAFFGDAKHVQILENYIYENKGMHSNGISIYGTSSDVLIARNKVFDSKNPLTFSGVSNFKVINNIFHGGNENPSMACWNGSTCSAVIIKHNLLLAGNSWGGGFFTQGGDIEGLVIKNNIIDGMADYPGSISHNIYTRTRSPLGTGEFVITNLTSIFVDPSNHDYRLRADSPAIDAGTNADVMDDIERNVRPIGSAPDIGAYEYSQ